MINKQASCSDIFESGLLPVNHALTTILKTISTCQGFEQIAISDACNRTLFESIEAPFSVPGNDNSAVDGYAFLSQDIPQHGHNTLTIAGYSYAGSAYTGTLQSGQCIRIMTGAPVPVGADTIAMQEHVAVQQDQIEIDNQLRSGQNIRYAGEDIRQGEIILKPGKFLMPADIGLLASIGIAEIKVNRKLRIAVASTGNEICNLGEQRSPGNLYDSNRYSLKAAMSRTDIEISDLGILPDDPELLLKKLSQAGESADMIITSGGVSVCDADYTKTALQKSGQIDFWKIAIKPGRPFAFGKLGSSVFFGLPGNPVAVLVTFYQFVLPAIEKMLGIIDKPISPQLSAISTENIHKKPGRTEIVRGILQQQNDGTWVVKTTGKQGSGILRSMSLANAFIVLEHERSNVIAGEAVTVQPFAGLMR